MKLKENIVKALIVLFVMLSVSLVIFISISFKDRENYVQINSDTEQGEQTKAGNTLLPTIESNEKEAQNNNRAETDIHSEDLVVAGKQNFRVIKNQGASTVVKVKKVSDWALNEKGNIQVEVILENTQKEKVFIQKVTLSIINYVEEKNLVVLEKETGFTIKPGDSVQITLEKKIDNINIFPENDGHLLYEVFLE
jgi:Na+-transporting NADH:ubiquinone oxidoreductase subunit NqrF